MFLDYKNRNILVTGHTGFKGSWLTIWLERLGANISGLSLEPYTSDDNFVLSSLEKRINHHIGDIRDSQKVNEVIEIEQPEIIFHLAAQPLVLGSYKNPLETIETNTLGTANILEAFRNSKIAQVLIIITTDKVYQNNEWIWGYRENDIIGGKDPYSASKAACEIITESYISSFFTTASNKYVASARAGNVIGGGDWSENRIIPDCIKSIEKDEVISIRNPRATRPWQHVLEPLAGYLMLGQKLLNGKSDFVGAWNFGPNYENNKSVEELVEKFLVEYGKGSFEIRQIANYPKESNYLFLDITKSRNILKWEPIFTFDKTLALTADWYKNYKTESVINIVNNQISEYESKWKSNHE
ncbi:MAG: CDP-glucose 4,6-dehydratase [Melioribacteraceae bacterium]|nr:CDP-glucose 4,6-dehydratase [Melioribacteraceae bacterium]MCF8265926.1 CDP-glucose 4,6-dehydratase [Melioribacteraceae bacterium]